MATTKEFPVFVHLANFELQKEIRNRQRQAAIYEAIIHRKMCERRLSPKQPHNLFNGSFIQKMLALPDTPFSPPIFEDEWDLRDALVLRQERLRRSLSLLPIFFEPDLFRLPYHYPTASRLQLLQNNIYYRTLRLYKHQVLTYHKLPRVQQQQQTLQEYLFVNKDYRDMRAQLFDSANLSSMIFGNSNVNSMFESFKSIASTIQNNMAGAGEALSACIGKFADIIGSLADGSIVTNWLRSGAVYQILGLIMDFYSLFKGDTYSRVRAIISIAGAFGIIDDLVTKFTNLISQIFDSIEVREGQTSANPYSFDNMEAQAGNVSATTSQIALFLGSIVFVCFRTVPNLTNLLKIANDFGVIFKTFSFAERGLDAIPKLVEFVKQTINWLTENILKYKLFNDTPEADGVQVDLLNRTIAWTQLVKNLDSGLLKDKILVDRQLREHVYSTYAEGQSIQQELLASEGQTTKLLHHVKELLRLVRTMKHECDKVLDSEGVRTDPHCIYLYGKPGTGKSAFIKTLVDLCCEQQGITENKVYERNCNDAYWSRLKPGTFATVMEEFASNLESTDVEEFLCAKSNVPWSPPKPGVEEKGEAFDCEAIIISSNDAYPQRKKLASKEAIWRRRNILACVAVKPEYATKHGCIDVSKIKQDSFDHYDFYLMDPMTPTPDNDLKNPMSAYDFLRYALEDQKRYLDEQRAFKARNKLTLKDLYPSPDTVHIVKPTKPSLPDAEVVSIIRPPVREPPVAAPRKQASWTEVQQVQLAEDSDSECDMVAQVGLQDLHRVHLGFQSEFRMHFDYIKQTTMQLKDKIMSLITQYLGPIKVILSILGAFAAAYGVYKLCSSTITDQKAQTKRHKKRPPKEDVDYKSKLTPTALSRFTPSTPKITDSPAPNAYNINDQQALTTFKAQSSIDLQSEQVLQARVIPYLVTIHIGDKYFIGYRFGGDKILTINHIRPSLVEGMDVLIKGSNGLSVHTKMHLPDFVQIHNKDVVVWKVGPKISHAPKNVLSFVSEDDLPRLDKSTYVLVTLLNGNPLIHLSKGEFVKQIHYILDNDGKETQLTLASGVSYSAATSSGDCGGILMHLNNRVPAKIVGVHVCGNGTVGAAEIVTREMLPTKDELYAQQLTFEFEPPSVTFVEGIETLGDIPGVWLPEKTNLRPFPWQNQLYPTARAPANLKHSRHPELLTNGAAKFHGQRPAFPKHIVDKVERRVGHLISFWKPLRETLISWTETIVGVPGLDFYDRINMSTSPGYPYNREGLKKADLIDAEGVPCERLLVRIDEVERMFDENVIPTFVWTDCLKDEKRKFVKVNSPRLFDIPPVEFTILVRHYFLDFVAAMKANQATSFSAIGIDPFSADWNVMFQRLAAFSTIGFSVDFSKFDGFWDQDCAIGIANNINNWYDKHFPTQNTPRHNKIRKILFFVMIHTYILSLKTLMLKHIGNPSGNPVTDVVNTLMHKYYDEIVWEHTYPNEEPQYEDKLYGDDGLKVVKKSHSRYNLTNYQRVMNSYGITVTDSKKDGESYELKPLMELDFLKCDFVTHPYSKNVVIAKIDIETIREMFNWYRDVLTPQAAYESNMRGATKMMFAHGEQAYNHFFESLYKVVEANGYKGVPHPFYGDMDVIFSSGTTLLGSSIRENCLSGLLCQQGTVKHHPRQQVETICSLASKENEQRGFDPFLNIRGSQNVGSLPIQPKMQLEHFLHTLNMATTKDTTFSAQTQDIHNIEDEIVTSVLSNTQATNVLFEDSKDIVTESANIGGDVISNVLANQRAIDENPWSIQNVMGRPLQIDSVNWMTTSVRGSLLLQVNIPDAILPGLSMGRGIMQQFTFYRAGFRFRIQLNGTRFHQGRLIMAYCPNLKVQDTNIVQFRSSLSTYPHVFLDASESNTAELVVPFLDYQHYRTTRGGDVIPLGQLIVMVYNQLQAADSASQELGLTLWSSFVNADLKIPSFQHMVAQSGRKLQKKEGIAGFIDSAKETVGGLGNQFMTKNPLGQLISGVGDKIGLNFKDMFRDKPNINMIQNPVILKTTSNLAYGVGHDNSDRLSLVPFTSTQDEKEVSTEVVDMQNLVTLIQTPSLVGTLTWNDTQTTGTTLIQYDINPIIGEFFDTEETHTFAPTLLAYVSMPFGRWSGSLKFRLEFVATQYHTGRLLCVLIPDDLNEEEVTIRKAMNLPNVTIDLQEAHEFDFIVPWISSTPMKNINTERPGGPLNRYQRTGTLIFYVLNPLCHPDNVANNVECNVFVAGGDDFQLYMPTDFFIPTTIQSLGMGEPPMRAQSGTGGSMALSRTEKNEREPLTLQFGIGKSTNTAGIVGEYFMNLKDVLSRYYLVQDDAFQFDLDYDFNQGVIMSYGVCPMQFSKGTAVVINGQEMMANRGTDPLSWFANLFRYWKGSLRYKFVFDTNHLDGVKGNIFHRFQQEDEDTRVGLVGISALPPQQRNYASQVYNLSFQPSIDVETPWYSRLTQIPNPRRRTWPTTTNGTLELTFQPNDSTVAASNADESYITVGSFVPAKSSVYRKFVIYISAGDDFNYNLFLGAPVLHYLN